MPSCGCPDVKLADGSLRKCSCTPCSAGELGQCSCNKETGCSCPGENPQKASGCVCGEKCTCSNCTCGKASAKNIDEAPKSCCGGHVEQAESSLRAAV